MRPKETRGDQEENVGVQECSDQMDRQPFRAPKLDLKKRKYVLGRFTVAISNFRWLRLSLMKLIDHSLFLNCCFRSRAYYRYDSLAWVSTLTCTRRSISSASSCVLKLRFSFFPSWSSLSLSFWMVRSFFLLSSSSFLLRSSRCLKSEIASFRVPI